MFIRLLVLSTVLATASISFGKTVLHQIAAKGRSAGMCTFIKKPMISVARGTFTGVVANQQPGAATCSIIIDEKGTKNALIFELGGKQMSDFQVADPFGVDECGARVNGKMYGYYRFVDDRRGHDKVLNLVFHGNSRQPFGARLADSSADAANPKIYDCYFR